MFVVERGAYPQEGVGKPDYTKEVSSSIERRGLRLKHNQTLKQFGIIFTTVNAGTHTAAVHATIMTDAAAYFAVNVLVDRIIVNETDGSSGVITANTETTVTVDALLGGATDQWNTGDVYIIPSPFGWVNTPLAAGASAHLVDHETGLAMPFTVPQGYALSLIADGFTLTEDSIVWAYIDGCVVINIGVLTGGMPYYENKVTGITTEVFDPIGAESHTVDVTIKNLGAGSLEGGVGTLGILEAVGTPPLPTTKTVKCKFCGNEETVPRKTTKWICPKCGQLNLYFDFSKFRGTR